MDSFKSAREHLQGWEQSKSSLLIRFQVDEGSVTLFGKIKRVLDDRVIFRPDGGERVMVLLKAADFEFESDAKRDCLTIRFARGGYCSFYARLNDDEEWPSFIDEPDQV